MSLDLEAIDVEHLLGVLDLDNVTDEGGEFRFSCPYPEHNDGDQKPSAYMNEETTAYFCHGCKAKGTAPNLVSYVLQISILEAIRLLKEAYMPGYIDPDVRRTVDEVRRIMAPKPESPCNVILPESTLDSFAVDWEAAFIAYDSGGGFEGTDYMFSRGFSYETLQEWQIGYDQLSGRVVLPVRDEKNRLVGFNARAWDGREPKYLILGDRPGRTPRYGFDCHERSKVVFGLGRALSEHADSEGQFRRVVLTEGELNAIACWQAGLSAVAINGSHFSEVHQKLLIREVDEVVLFFDTDTAGLNAAWGWEDSKGLHHPGVVERLSPFIHVKIVPDHEADPADMTDDQIHELVGRAVGSVTAAIC